MNTDATQAFQPIEDDVALDGNAVGGMLATVLGLDVTAAEGTCSHCATVNPVARLRAYEGGPGWVLRCPACSSMVLRLMVRNGVTILEMTGLRRLALRSGEQR